MGLRERHVRKWAHRFLRDSPAGLDDAPRSGRPPVHCSWMNQVEQWFSILQRKRLRSVDFADKAMLAERLLAFASRWNEPAHPFNWSTKSAAKVMAQCQLSQAA